jgi:YidC/Oxa1 family membrane protein insertase
VSGTPLSEQGQSGGLDTRTLIAIAISVGIVTVWPVLFPPEPVPEDPEPAGAAVLTADPAAAPPAAVATPAAVVERKLEPFKLCGATGMVDNVDGGLSDVLLPDHQDRYHTQSLFGWASTLFSGPWSPYGEEPGIVRLASADADLLIAGAGGVSPAMTVTVSPGVVITEGTASNGLRVRRELRERPAAGDTPCAVDVKVAWTNGGEAELRGPLWFGVYDRIEPNASSYEIGMHPVASGDGDVEELSDPEDAVEPIELGEPVDWLGVNNQYFTAVLAPIARSEETEGAGGGGRLGVKPVAPTTGSAGDAIVGTTWVEEAAGEVVGLAPGETRERSFVMYMGPKRIGDLSSVDPRLSSVVQLGFFSMFALPLLYLLSFIHGFLGDWALSIVGLTFIVKAVFFPLSQRAYASSQEMQAIQPELQALREKHKGNPEELNRQTMLLFQTRGVNPMAGCFPMLVQTPVWIALYSVLQTSVELYHASFAYIRDLTVADPYMVLPVLVTALMAAQQRMMPTANMNPEQEQVLKWMPVIFGMLFFSLPAGLLLYIFVNTTLSILQQWYIKTTYKPVTRTLAPAEG